MREKIKRNTIFTFFITLIMFLSLMGCNGYDEGYEDGYEGRSKKNAYKFSSSYKDGYNDGAYEAAMFDEGYLDATSGYPPEHNDPSYLEGYNEGS